MTYTVSSGTLNSTIPHNTRSKGMSIRRGSPFPKTSGSQILTPKVGGIEDPYKDPSSSLVTLRNMVAVAVGQSKRVYVGLLKLGAL